MNPAAASSATSVCPFFSSCISFLPGPQRSFLIFTTARNIKEKIASKLYLFRSLFLFLWGGGLYAWEIGFLFFQPLQMGKRKCWNLLKEKDMKHNESKWNTQNTLFTKNRHIEKTTKSFKLHVLPFLMIPTHKNSQGRRKEKQFSINLVSIFFFSK